MTALATKTQSRWVWTIMVVILLVLSCLISAKFLKFNILQNYREQRNIRVLPKVMKGGSILRHGGFPVSTPNGGGWKPYPPGIESFLQN